MFLWKYIFHGGVVHISMEVYISWRRVVYISMEVYILWRCSVHFYGSILWRFCVYFYGCTYFISAKFIFLWKYIFYGGGVYIAIPGATERSVQHLITRVWGARGASSSSLSS